MSLDDSPSKSDTLFKDDPMPLDGIVDEEDAEDLKLDNADTKVWLVKIPDFLAEKWSKVDQDDINLGTIRIYNQPPPGQSSPISLILSEEGAMGTGLREYNISIMPGKVQNKFVFEENESGSRSISGTVHHECTAMPSNINEYQKTLRQRQQEVDTPARSVQFHKTIGLGSFGHSNQSMQFIPSKKAKATLDKATRMPRNELQDILFNKFEQYSYWNIKALAKVTKQPQQYLKEVLGDICIFNKRGPYTGNYQLKPEYIRRGSSVQQTMGSDSGTPSARNDTDVIDEDDSDEDEEMEDIL